MSASGSISAAQGCVFKKDREAEASRSFDSAEGAACGQLEYRGERHKMQLGVCRGASAPGQRSAAPLNGSHASGGGPHRTQVRRRAVMGNLYQYAMRKCSLSVCQARHGQSSGSVVVRWRDGVACGRPSLGEAVSGSLVHPGNRSDGLLRKLCGRRPSGRASHRHDNCTTQRLRTVEARQGSASAGTGRVKAVTWLILPVVICLSQRLSHACLSINCLYGETANGSLNQLEFI